MGHKSIVLFDHDNLENMRVDPAEFVRRLEIAILEAGCAVADTGLSSIASIGGSVSVGGITVAKVVWSGRADQSPTFRFNDFKAVAVEPPVRTKRIGYQYGVPYGHFLAQLP